MSDDWRARALRAEAEVVALKAALDETLTAIDEVESEPGRGSAPIFRVDWFAKMKLVRDSGAGADLLDAVRKAREALRRLTGETCLHDDGDPDCDVCVGRLALAELSRFLPEGT